jgi:basic amino acid/polyamine antiporter, APA family
MAIDNSTTDAQKSADLPRRLGLGTATALIVGNVIGIGIFLTPAEMAKSLGSPFWLLAVWLLMAVATIGGALSYAALAVRYPEAGGTYVYLREIFGRRTAFLYGWLSLLVTDPGLTAMFAVGMAPYVGHLIPLGPWGLKAVAAGSIIAIAAVHTLGISPGSRIMGALTMLKLGLLGFLVIWGFGLGRGDWSNLTPFWSQRPGSSPFLPAFGLALVGAFIAFAGWWDVSKIAGEVRDPKRTMPRALMLGVSIVTVVYVAVSVVFLYLVAPARIAADGGAFAALAGDALFGRRGEVIFSLVVIVCVVGSLASYLMAAPRVYFAMARDGIFFASFGAVDPRRDVPARGTMVQATLAVVLAVVFSFEQILSYIMVPTLLFLALTVAGIFVLHRRHPSERALAPLGYPITPLLFLLPMVTVIVLQIARYPVHSSIGLAVVALGFPAAGWVISERPSSDGSNAPDSTTEMTSPESTLDDPSAVPSIDTQSSITK